MSGRELTGWHVLAIFGGAFAIIIGVNLTLAFKAVSTFPGLEVKNSYVASQTFDAERAAQEALGWRVIASVEGTQVRLRIEDETGAVQPTITRAEIGRPTEAVDDRQLAFAPDGDGFVAPAMGLRPGYWYLRLHAEAADGTAFRQRVRLRVPG